MPKKAEVITKQELNTFAELRHSGTQKLDNCLQQSIKEMEILEQVALLADTGRLKIYYEAIGLARLQGNSWRKISAAARGKTETEDGQDLHRMYLSYCKNNDITPVKIRKNTAAN